jgi:hypothetical protein
VRVPPVTPCALLESFPPAGGGTQLAPLAQLDRASGYEPGGRRFKSCRARHFNNLQPPKSRASLVVNNLFTTGALGAAPAEVAVHEIGQF